MSRPNIYKALKPFRLSNWVSIARVVARFPEANWLLPSSTAANSETPYVCARPSDPPNLCRSAAPRAWPLILPLNLLLSSRIAFGRNCQMNWVYINPHPRDRVVLRKTKPTICRKFFNLLRVGESSLDDCYWKIQSDSDGAAWTPPPYLKNTNYASTSLMWSNSNCMHQDTRHVC